MFKFSKMILHVILIAIIMFPASGRAEGINAAERACVRAKGDARKDVNESVWISMDFFFLIFGVVVANVIVPDPPAYRLIGKSPEYVSSYVECYRKTICDIQDRAALKGCIAGTCILPFVYMEGVLLMTLIARMFPVNDDAAANCFFYFLIVTFLQS